MDTRLASNNPTNSPFYPTEPDWQSAGCRFLSLNYFLRWKFGHRVHKISLDGGFGCPNRDASPKGGGCIFCDNRSFSPSRRQAEQPPVARQPIARQIDEAVGRLKSRYDVDHFIGYFQPGTNTYAPVERLREVFLEALANPCLVGLAIGTRPDCVADDVLDLLAELAGQTYLVVEFGLQTIHDRSLDWLNRGHHYSDFLDAVRRSHLRKLNVGAHVILGLPGESADDMRATAREITRLGIHSVKIHNLMAIRDTPLGTAVSAGEVSLIDRRQYVGHVVDFLEELSPQCIVDRLTGDAPAQYLLAPHWCLDKQAVLRAIDDELVRRDTWQGKRCERS
ncbi:MAG: TIGR01212 family radical SAM protein [Planctomycetes bacterium]|nr:TIGR01212 family radical SAM protein [Planctomycetota bacterium]